MQISPVDPRSLRRHDPFVAVPLAGREGSPFRLNVLHPLDLALSKVARFADHDRADIAALATLGVFDADALLRLGEEALAYAVGNPTFARLNLRDAAEIVAREHPGGRATARDGEPAT